MGGVDCGVGVGFGGYRVSSVYRIVFLLSLLSVLPEYGGGFGVRVKG